MIEHRNRLLVQRGDTVRGVEAYRYTYRYGEILYPSAVSESQPCHTMVPCQLGRACTLHAPGVRGMVCPLTEKGKRQMGHRQSDGRIVCDL